MKNIYLLIFILIFLYIICNGYIENFNVGCQSSKKTPINISGSLTLPYIDNCNPCQNDGKYINGKCECSASYTGDRCNLCKIKSGTKYTYWVPPDTCTCPENTILYTSSGKTRCGPPPQCDGAIHLIDKCGYAEVANCSKYYTKSTIGNGYTICEKYPTAGGYYACQKPSFGNSCTIKNNKCSLKNKIYDKYCK